MPNAWMADIELNSTIPHHWKWKYTTEIRFDYSYFDDAEDKIDDGQYEVLPFSLYSMQFIVK